MTYNSIITYSLGEVKKRSSMIIKNREKCFGLFFSGGKNELCIFFISRNWKLFFWCCNTCCISCSIRHQSVHFFSKNVNRQSLDDIFSQVQGDSYGKVTYFQNIPNKIKLLSSVSLMDFIHKCKYLLQNLKKPYVSK